MAIQKMVIIYFLFLNFSKNFHHEESCIKLFKVKNLTKSKNIENVHFYYKVIRKLYDINKV